MTETQSAAPAASSRDRRYLFLAIPLGILVAPIALMLIASPVVVVWVGLNSLLGLDLPVELDSLLPLGPLGDVFGGLLGPLLNALVLGATIWIALSQGKRARVDAKFARANGVVAWVAETPRDRTGKSHLGVVVTNTSGSLVRDLDLVVTVTSSGLPRRNKAAQSRGRRPAWKLVPAARPGDR